MDINNNKGTSPTPFAGKKRPVEWFFAFKFNAASFPGCSASQGAPKTGSKGIFGGQVNAYPRGHSQQYIYATNENPSLIKGRGCLGSTLNDPLGATFAQVYLTNKYNVTTQV